MTRNIGILIPSKKEAGGVFQSALSIAESLIKYSNSGQYAAQYIGRTARYKFKYSLFYDGSDNPESFLDIQNHNVKLTPLPRKSFSLPRKILQFLIMGLGGKKFLIKSSYLIFKEAQTDLLIFPTPFAFDFPIDIPYITSIPDLMYRYYPNFPDYPLSLRIRRNIVYKYFARNSKLIIVDSEQGADDVEKFFNIKKDRIRIIPFLPASYIYMYKDMDYRTVEELLAKYNLPEKFLFYPAQFWPHKNHQRLIKVICQIKNEYKTKVNLVLVGSFSAPAKKTYNEIRQLIKKLGVEDQIFHLGFVPDKEIVALYKRAIALVFPTLIGPTSIPPVEAMVLGTPVLCSNLFEMPKQIGEGGLLFDPFDVKDIKEKIYTIWTNENLRRELIQKGHNKTKDLTLENYSKQWEKVIEEALNLENRK